MSPIWGKFRPVRLASGALAQVSDTVPAATGTAVTSVRSSQPVRTRCIDGRQVTPSQIDPTNGRGSK